MHLLDIDNMVAVNKQPFLRLLNIDNMVAVYKPSFMHLQDIYDMALYAPSRHI